MTNLHSDKIENTNLHTTTNHIYTNTKLRKLLVPIIIEQLLASLMGTVDTMMVSNVGLCFLFYLNVNLSYLISFITI